jgi:hypothetical protein
MKLEISPSGRAACRGCKSPVAKGEVRFAESYTIPGGDQPGHRYWHLACAAKKNVTGFTDALSAYEGEVPERETLLALVAAAPKKKGKDLPLPHVDRAPTSRAKCIQCSEPIEKGAYRIGVERDVDAGGFGGRAAGYMHPACVPAYAEEHLGDESVDDLLAKVFTNAQSSPDEMAEVRAQVASS